MKDWVVRGAILPASPDDARPRPSQDPDGVGVMRSLLRSIRDLDRAVVAHLGEHPDAEVFTSLPRSGRINAAQMLAEWGDCREAYPEPDAVAMLGGLCPVTYASGKQRKVSFRWACNKRLREALTVFADNSRHASPWAAEVYGKARARGCDHPHAVRVLARAWVRVIWPLLAGTTALRPGPPWGRSSSESRMRLMP